MKDDLRPEATTNVRIEKTIEPISVLVQELKGRKFRLDCGHVVTIGDGRSNTLILYANGKAVCHRCGY